jgi:hypothetical protein
MDSGKSPKGPTWWHVSVNGAPQISRGSSRQFATGKSADATGSFVERDWGGTAPWAGAFAASKETEGKKMWLALASITLGRQSD